MVQYCVILGPVTEIQEQRLNRLVLVYKGELKKRLDEIPRDLPIVVHCKLGPRAIKGCKILLKHGFTEVYNLTGGIIAWADEIDSTMKRY